MSIVKSYSFPEGDIRGDMFYIKHNSNNFTVIDCYLKDGDGKNARRDEIIREIIDESYGRIRRFISTHPDNDHIAGIEFLDDEWNIENFYAVKNDRPADDDDSLIRYKWLLTKKNYAVRRNIERAWLNISTVENGSSGINFQWPDLGNEKFKQALELVSEGKKINNICPIFTYRIENGATYMWMGDLDTEMQQAYYDEFVGHIPKVDILFQPHHGRESGSVPKALLNALAPELIIIGNAPAEYIDYGDSSKTITQNKAGDILFENEDNEVHVFTKNIIDNKPTCLKTKLGKDDKARVIHRDWYYVRTLTV